MLLLFWQSSDAQWDYLGLKNMKVNALEIQDKYIYAATDNGLFKKEILLSDTIWSTIGFQNKQVNDIYIRDTSHLYATVQITGSGADTISLFVTYNGGITWNSLWGEYDPSQLSYLQTGEVEGVRSNSDTIIIMSGGIRKSIDGGASFTKVSNNGGRFLTIAPDNPNSMWTGGEGVLLNPYLIQSTNEGESWFDNDSLHQIVSGDNACLCADIHPTNSDIIYVGMEGQIGKSIDNGLNWIRFWMYPYYVKGIKISPTNPSVIYATGGAFGGYSIALFVSNNDGSSWDTLKYYIGTVVDPLELAVQKHNGTDLIFIGTRNIGIYRYENIVNSVFDKYSKGYSNYSVYPNPFVKCATLEFDNPEKEKHVLIIYNIQGQIVQTKTDLRAYKVQIERNKLINGMYYFQLRKGNEIRALGKLIIN